METAKRVIKALVASFVILLIALITCLFVNIIAEISPTLLIIICVVVLLKSGYSLTED